MNTKFIKPIPYLLIYLFMLFPSLIYGAIPSTERAALIALYNSTDGDNWRNIDNKWKTEDGEFKLPGTEDTWHGITVENDHVTAINLSSNRLSGTIPAELGNLLYLTSLNLAENYLSGTIPDTVEDLSELTSLNLSYNLLEAIPPELGNLSNLVSLDLSHNSLKGTIPESLENLIDLKVLDLHSNQLKHISSDLDFGNLTLLAELYLNDNIITDSIPTSLGSLTSLKELSLFNNQFSGEIPAKLGNLTALILLNLHNNQLSGAIPPDLNTLSSLKIINISSNNLSGEIPFSETVLNNLTNLLSDFHWNALYLEDTNLAGIINDKQRPGDGDWQSTQTVAPTGVIAEPRRDKILTVKWDPIDFTTIDDTIKEGYYEVCYSSTEGGPYTCFKATETKDVSEIKVEELTNREEYHFVVKSVTYSHSDNKNKVTSEGSEEESAIVLSAIRGRVYNKFTNERIPGVTLKFSIVDTEEKTTTTNSDGYYSLPVPYQWSGTVTPSIDGYTFDSTGHSYENVTADQIQNYFATPDSRTLTVQVTKEGIGIPGVTITFEGIDEPGITDNDGIWSQILYYEWSGRVTLSKTGYVFFPADPAPITLTKNRILKYTAYDAHTISVKVVTDDENKTGVPDITLTYEIDGTILMPITGADGTYNIPVNSGWSGKITPSKDGYTFAPTEKQYENVTQNEELEFKATAPTNSYRIWGYVVTNDRKAIPGAELTFLASDNTSVTVTTNSNNGYYAQTVAHGWSGTVTPYMAGYSFTPDKMFYPSVTSDQTMDYIGETITNPVILVKVKTEDSKPFPGVTITFKGDDESTITKTTDANGEYSRTVDHGWSCSVTPSKTGYTFTPPVKELQDVTEGQTLIFHEKPENVEISGDVTTIDGTPIDSVTITFKHDNGFTKVKTTDANGHYNHYVVYGWSGTVTPSKSGYLFNPEGEKYTDLHRKQVLNFIGKCNSPVISGYVATGDDKGVNDVTLTFIGDDGDKLTATTNAKGRYSQEVNCGWSGTVIPEKKDYSFAPPEKKFTNVFENKPCNFEAYRENHTISGKVVTEQGEGIAEVTLIFSNGGGSTTTDSNGRYGREVNHGWSGTVTPSKTDFTFTPEQITYPSVTTDKSGQNYTGKEDTPIISGTVVTGGNTGISGVLITFMGINEVSVNTWTDASGGFSQTVANGWSGTVTPSKTGYSFTPLNEKLENVTTDRDFKFTATKSASIPEISGQISITTETGTSGVPEVEITFSNSGGTAFTDINGNYENTVDIGWSGTAVPSKKGFKFTPEYISHIDVRNDKTGQNYTAQFADNAISGRILTDEGVGIAGVRLTCDNNGGSTETDFNGDYQLEVRNNWSGTVTPFKKGYSFEPGSRIYPPIAENTPGQDFIAVRSSGYPIISGKVQIHTKDGLVGLPGVTLVFDGDGGSAETNDDGRYSHAVKDWKGTVTPTKDGYEIPPKYYASILAEDKQDQDYIASRHDIKIKGKITTRNDETIPVENVILKFYDDTGNIDYQTQTGENGEYNQSVRYEWSGTVRPGKTGYRFNEEYYTYPLLKANAVLNFIADPSVFIKIEASRVTESTMVIRKQYGKIKIEVELDPQPDREVSKYIILRKESGDTGFTRLDEISHGIYYYDETLKDGVDYTYKVIAEDARGYEIGVSREKTI